MKVEKARRHFQGNFPAGTVSVQVRVAGNHKVEAESEGQMGYIGLYKVNRGVLCMNQGSGITINAD